MGIYIDDKDWHEIFHNTLLSEKKNAKSKTLHIYHDSHPPVVKIFGDFLIFEFSLVNYLLNQSKE